MEIQIYVLLIRGHHSSTSELSHIERMQGLLLRGGGVEQPPEIACKASTAEHWSPVSHSEGQERTCTRTT